MLTGGMAPCVAGSTPCLWLLHEPAFSTLEVYDMVSRPADIRTPGNLSTSALHADPCHVGGAVSTSIAKLCSSQIYAGCLRSAQVTMSGQQAYHDVPCPLG